MFRSFGRYSRRSLWIALLLLPVAGGGARGQWRIVAPKLLPPEEYDNSAITFCDGVIWAGVGDNPKVPASLCVSRDTGKTWLPVIFPGKIIREICFFDSDTGIISADKSIFLTADGGKTWKKVLTASDELWKIAFNGSSRFMHAISFSGAMQFFASSDFGASWHSSKLSNAWGNCFGVSTNHTIYAFATDGAPMGSVAHSSDFGLTWSANGASIDGDSYSLAVDSCNDSRLYVANEDYANQGDGFSQVFLSINGGLTWQVALSHPRYYLSGTMINTAQAIYVGTVATESMNGVIRSLDQGLTWTNIQGPSVGNDTRTLAAVNNNILFALDTNGNIWETLNSGGDSIRASSFASELSTSPNTLFSLDTIACDSITRTLVFGRRGCEPLSVINWFIGGRDSANFKARNLSYDSISVTLYGLRQGSQKAQLILSLDNNSNDTISLTGFVNISQSVLSVSTNNIGIDTLGAPTSIPITLTGLAHPEDIDLILRYDGTMDYLGSFSASGAKLDIAGGQWTGRSKLHIPGAAPGVVAGYAKFSVFSDSGQVAHVTFDSLDVLTAVSPCQYVMPAAAVSTITVPVVCGSTIISRFMHFGGTPVFSVRPNPATGDVWVSCSEDLGEVNLSVFDVLGAERGSDVVTLAKGSPVRLSLPESDGVYRIVVRSAAGAYTLKVVRQR